MIESYVWHNPDLKKRKQRSKATFGLLVALLLLAPAIMAAVTQIDLTVQVKGTLPTGNGGTGTASTLTGIVRGGSAYTAAELSGDCSTSGSNAVTCAKINGNTVGTGVVYATSTVAFKSVAASSSPTMPPAVF